ncbi:MAG TPA: hypothetical protein VF707_07110 [Ardenticatenaceae bacterium]|jgi:hypothetical protein
MVPVDVDQEAPDGLKEATGVDEQARQHLSKAGVAAMQGQDSAPELSHEYATTPRKPGDVAKWQGDIGEGVTIAAVVDKLGLTPDPRFDQPYHGVDGVYQDEQGAMVVGESKFTEKGIKALEGNQMQPDWLAKRALMMQDPESKQYTPGNAQIGADIQKAGAENVRRLVITTDPKTLVTQGYEGQSNGTWKLIGSWSALGWEQPTLPDEKGEQTQVPHL